MASFFERLETPGDDPPTRATDRPQERSPLLLVNLLSPRRGAAGRGWRAYQDDLGGFAVGSVLILLLVAATAVFLAL